MGGKNPFSRFYLLWIYYGASFCQTPHWLPYKGAAHVIAQCVQENTYRKCVSARYNKGEPQAQVELEQRFVGHNSLIYRIITESTQGTEEESKNRTGRTRTKVDDRGKTEQKLKAGGQWAMHKVGGKTRIRKRMKSM